MLSGAKACKSCRSRQELSNDTAVDEPPKVFQELVRSSNTSEKNIGRRPRGERQDLRGAPGHAGGFPWRPARRALAYVFHHSELERILF